MEIWEILRCNGTIITAVCALVVSVVSVYHQVKSAKRQRQHFKMTVRPHLDLDLNNFFSLNLTAEELDKQKNDPEKGIDELLKMRFCSVSLINKGVGPAILKEVVLIEKSTGSKYFPTKFALKVLKEFTPLQKANHIENGLAIRTGEEFRFLEFLIPKGSFDDFVRLFSEFEIRFEYTDLYGSVIGSEQHNMMTKPAEQQNL